MSVYPVKNRRGELTGVWAYDLVFQGNRYKGRTRDFNEAMEAERRIKQGLEPEPPPPRPVVAPAVVEAIYTLQDLWKDNRRRIRDHKSAKSTEQRLSFVMEFLGWQTDITTVRTRDLDRFVQHLEQTKQGRSGVLSPKTINRYLAAFQACMTWAHEREYIKAMPKFPRFDEGEGRIHTVSHDDEARMDHWLRTAETQDNHSFEDVARVQALLLGMGFRINELLSITADNLIEDADGLWVQLYGADTKTGYGREVPVPKPLEESLRAFVTEGWPHYRRILKALKRAREALGITAPISPHVYRHTTATRLDKAGKGSGVIGKILGHRSPATTAKYIHPDKDSLRSALESPAGGGLVGDFSTKSNKTDFDQFLKKPSKALENQGFLGGGLARNRTGVQGFAGSAVNGSAASEPTENTRIPPRPEDCT